MVYSTPVCTSEVPSAHGVPPSEPFRIWAAGICRQVASSHGPVELLLILPIGARRRPGKHPSGFGQAAHSALEPRADDVAVHGHLHHVHLPICSKVHK